MKCVYIQGNELIVGDRPIPEIGDGEVLIKVHCTALNRADLMQAAGKYPPPPGVTDILGLEVSGEVVKVGPNCERLAIGQKVSALLAGGGYAEFCAVDERLTIPMGEDQTFVDAAAIPEVWLTAYQLLHLVAKIEPSDRLLVHAGASGVGTAAIQLAKQFGVSQILVTAGSDEKIEFCKSLGADDGFNYKTSEDWSQDVVKATDGKGATVILDCIGYPYVDKNSKAIATDGKWVVFGLMGGIPPTLNGEQMMPAILRTILIKRIQILGTTLRARKNEYKADLIQKFYQATAGAFKEGKLKPVLDAKRFQGLASIKEAHLYMLSNQSIGKIILSVL